MNLIFLMIQNFKFHKLIVLSVSILAVDTQPKPRHTPSHS
jgi:hypothetical protein